ncbi:hypothetical protein Y1Q_0022709 [Alligator mississippiensis]|uniref:Uncharacterized protein n=1 Tax=Alligator mississippiensis TaxID=8496 RepID=A0A151MYG9_ALLMI|nr:hypothetical protein Y1Q_0022709 [Alligator mississippiensis]
MGPGRLKFRVCLLALEERHMEALEQQTVLMAKAVEAMEVDRWVLDTILALAVAFMLPAVLLLTTALPSPWQSPTTQQQAPSWTWAELQSCFHWLEIHAPAPALSPPTPSLNTWA